jgi:hypothetical protein
MTGFIDRVLRQAEDVAISTIKDAQPGFNIFYELEPQLDRIVKYVEGTFRCIDYLSDHAPQKLKFQVIKGALAGVTALVMASLFISTISSLLFATLFVSPAYLVTAAINLIIAYGAGYITIQLLRDVDAYIRYDALIAGLTNWINSN